MGRDELAGQVRDWIMKHDPRGRLSAFDGRHLGKIERGSVRRPGADVRAALCALLGASEADLGFLPHKGTGDAVSTRSELLSPDLRSLQGIGDVLASIRRLEDSTGPANVLPTVRAQRALAARLTDAFRGETRKSALDLMANIETYLGWLMLSVGKSADARTHLDQACVIAMEGDLPQRLATALSFHAYRSQARGDLIRAADQTEAAARDPRVHTGLRAYLHYQRAEFLAKDGQRTDARSSIRTADGLAGSLSAGTGAWNQPGFYSAHRAFALAALGDSGVTRAVTEARALLPAYSSALPLRLRQAHRRLDDLDRT